MVPILIDNLSKVFRTRRGAVQAVRDVSLTVRAGELFFLLGPSGCGKTTLLRMLAGFVDPSAGRILFGQRDVTHLAPERRDAAMVFQNYALWPHMTVEENVGFGPRIRRLPGRQRRDLVGRLLETVRISEKASAKPMELSGGQQQRVALARALAAQPRCLLLDEPLSNLDAALRAAMRWEIRRIVKETAATAVYVTHDQAEALAIADRIAVMHEGRVAQVGTGPELYERPASRFVAEFLGEGNFLDATVRSASGEAVVLETPVGVLGARGGAGLSAGDRATCCIRPESLRLAPADASGPATNVFSARLVEWVHLGDSARFRLQTGAAALSGAVMPARPVAAVGQTVSVQVAPEDVVALRP